MFTVSFTVLSQQSQKVLALFQTHKYANTIEIAQKALAFETVD